MALPTLNMNTTPTTIKPVLAPPPGAKPPSAAGLMSLGTTSPAPQPITATGYKPQLLGQGTTLTQHAVAYGYDPTSMTATTYDPTMIDKTGTTYDPTTQQVQGNQLVSNQLTGLLAGNSKYIQDARQQGLEQAARSGLMTSSIAAGNAERSAIQAAEPIAAADASRFGSVADQNMGATNTAGQFNAGSTLQANTNNAQFTNTASATNATAKNQAAAANMEAANAAAAAEAAAKNNVSQFNAASYNNASATNAAAVNQANQFNANVSNTAQQQNASLPIQREGQMTEILNGIYSNPNLTAQEQQTAAANAKAVMTGLWNATNQTFAAGVPQIFANAA